MMQVEKNVPVQGFKLNKYPFLLMDVGDSFAFDGPREKLAAAASYAGLRHGLKFSVRKTAEGNYRCWRVA